MADKQLILFAHGSSDPQWSISIEKLFNSLNKKAKTNISLAYLNSSPALYEVVSKSVEEGITRFKLLPLFISRGKHVENDLALLLQDLKKEFKSIRIELLPSIGEYKEFYLFMQKIIMRYG